MSLEQTARPPEELARLLQTFCSESGTVVPLAISYAELLSILLRIRRTALRDRCLYVPNWILTEAGITTIPNHFCEFYKAQSGLGNPGGLTQVLKGFLYPTRRRGLRNAFLRQKTWR